MSDTIRKFCKDYGLRNWVINPDGISISISGNVDLSHDNLKELPIPFSKVTGNFNVSYNLLNSFKNFPTYIGGDLNLQANNFDSFDGLDNINFGKKLILSKNPIKSFKKFPKNIKNQLILIDCGITDDIFKTLDLTVNSDQFQINLMNNLFENLDLSNIKFSELSCQSSISKNVLLNNCNIKNIINIPSQFSLVDLSDNYISSLLFLKELTSTSSRTTRLMLYNNQISEIPDFDKLSSHIKLYLFGNPIKDPNKLDDFNRKFNDIVEDIDVTKHVLNDLLKKKTVMESL